MADGGRTRRDLLRSLTGAGFFGTVAEACAPSARRHTQSTNPPSERPVIPAGKEAEVLALLGPLAHEPFDSYKLERAVVGAERIDYAFAGPGGAVRIALVALTATDAGVPHAYTRSFRLIAEGEAPAEARRAVADRVAAEVLARDRGQLWTRADHAPRQDAGDK